MRAVTDKIHRILAPRLIVTIGTTSKDGRKNIIPINNITSVSTEPGMCLIAVYHPWITAKNLKTAKGFTISVPSKNQLELIWKLGQKYSGYESNLEKVEEFKRDLNLNFSDYGPVLKEALGWIECEIVDLPDYVDANHLLVIGKYTKAAVNEGFYTDEINAKNNPKPIMQWERNNFSAASDIFSLDYFNDPGDIK
ncbi:MAG TPA: flavin reductase family protein [Candidatus Saccharimonadales bacterium]|nr:flavin reductase family protein [Candidatus Saccharimonadales bacterium]